MVPPPPRFSLQRSASIPPGAFSLKDLEQLGAFVLAAEKAPGPVELSLELTGHRRIRALNRQFRGVDRTTDVISFRNDVPAPVTRASGGELPRMEGDIAINVAQAALQARKEGHSLKREIRLLWIHGILHLLGYTDYDPIPRRRMFKRQNALLRRWEKRR